MEVKCISELCLFLIKKVTCSHYYNGCVKGEGVFSFVYSHANPNIINKIKNRKSVISTFLPKSIVI
jgi:hypothetical protein